MTRRLKLERTLAAPPAKPRRTQYNVTLDDAQRKLVVLASAAAGKSIRSFMAAAACDVAAEVLRRRPRRVARVRIRGPKPKPVR